MTWTDLVDDMQYSRSLRSDNYYGDCIVFKTFAEELKRRVDKQVVTDDAIGMGVSQGLQRSTKIIDEMLNELGITNQ